MVAESEYNQTVGVIGAGVAGLQVAAALKKAGLQVTVFEKSGNVGGVWRSNYVGYKLQVQRWHYDIPGYPWPEGTSYPYPTGQEVQSYLEAFARDSGLTDHIHFNTSVQGVTPLGDKGDEGWLVTYSTTKPDEGQHTASVAVGFLVVATGLYSIPHRPSWATHDAVAASSFHGEVVDAKDFTDLEQARGKRVVVVGAGKTAIDVAVSVSEVAEQATLLARKGHVWAPQWILGVIPFEFAVYTRWSWALLPPWYTDGVVSRFIHALFSPVKAAAWKLFEVMFPLHTATPGLLKHPHSLLAGIFDTIGILHAPAVRHAFTSGALQGERGEVATLDQDGVLLTDGRNIKADLIILATGYRNIEQQLLPEELRSPAGYDKDGTQWLYRNLLPVGLQNIAFLGLNATFQHVLTTALQSRWLTAVLTGEIKLPSRQQQEADIQARKAWLRSSAFPFTRNNNFIWAHFGRFHDQLVADLSYPVRRKGLNIFAELFGFIKNEDFSDVVNLAPDSRE